MLITSPSDKRGSSVVDNDKTIVRKKYRSSNGNPRTYFDNSSGRYIAPAIIQLPDGRKKTIRGSGIIRAEAEKKRDKLIAKYKNLIVISERDLSFLAEYCQHWLDNIKHKKDIKRRTRIGYQNSINLWIQPMLGNCKVQELKREDIQKVYAEIERQNKSRSCANQVAAVLNQALDEAVASGYISINLARTVSLPKKRKLLPIYFTHEEVVLIKNKATEKDEWLRWALALLIGLRQGECLGLRWNDVSLDEAVIRVRNSLTRVPNLGLVLEDLKTSSSVRDIPLPQEIVQLFRNHKKAQLESRLITGANWIEQDFVFTTKQGNPIDSANDRKLWDKLLLEAGVGPKKLHAARHTAATLLLAQGIDLFVISKILGHSSINTTAEYYAHVQNHSKLEALTSYGPELLKSC